MKNQYFQMYTKLVDQDKFFSRISIPPRVKIKQIILILNIVT